jgi:hypothetical protein
MENLYLILVFIVPGVVALSVRSKFLTGRSPSLTENLLTFLVLSLVYYGFTIPFINAALSVREPWLAHAGIWVLLILVGPAIFGLVLGIAAQKEWGIKLANKLFADRFDVGIVHVIPTAWDWRFSKMPREGMFVLVTLTDGSVVAGLFGTRSFASSDVADRDLYIEEEYTVTEKGNWEARPQNVGILVPAKEIRYVEFWQPK